MSYVPNPLANDRAALRESLSYPLAAGVKLEFGDFSAFNGSGKLTILRDTAGLRGAGIFADGEVDNSASTDPGSYAEQRALGRIYTGEITCMVRVPVGVEPAPFSQLYALDRHTLALDPADTTAKLPTPWILLRESDLNSKFPSLVDKLYIVSFSWELAKTVIPA